MTISARAARRVRGGPLAPALLVVALAGCGSSRPGGGSQADTAKPAPSAPTTRPAPHSEDPYADPVISHVPPRQLAAFALLRTPAEGLPPATRRILRRHAFGINWKLAQRIPVEAEGAYWLVAGDGHLCLIAQGVMHGRGVGTTCSTTSKAIAHGVAEVNITLPGAAGRTLPSAAGRTLPDAARRTRLIVGVAPDGARAALVHTGGAIAVAPIHHEVFVLRDSTLAPPDAITLRWTRGALRGNRGRSWRHGRESVSGRTRTQAR